MVNKMCKRQNALSSYNDSMSRLMITFTLHSTVLSSRRFPHHLITTGHANAATLLHGRFNHVGKLTNCKRVIIYIYGQLQRSPY